MSEQEQKFKVVCPSCGVHYSVPFPPIELSNNLRSSIAIGTHERPTRCINCRQAICFMIEAVQVVWRVQPLPDDAVASLEESRIIAPSNALVSKLVS